MRHAASIRRYIMEYRYPLALLIGVLAGTFFANASGRQNIDNWGIFNEDYLEMFAAVSFNYQQLWWYVLGQRIKLLLLVLLCGLTSIRSVCMSGFMLTGGFMLGMYVSIASMQYGLAGLLLVLASLMPHWIFYSLAADVIIKTIYSNINKTGRRAASLMLVAVLFMTGICAEVLINPMLVKNVIYILY